MPDLKQALKDFVATANSGKYTDEATLLSKFPELQGYDINALKDFVATANSGKYTNEDELFSKFPEFAVGGTQPVSKKKDTTALPSADGSLASQKPKEEVGILGNVVGAINKSTLKGIIGEPAKAIGTFLQGTTKKIMGGTGEGAISNALIKFGNSYNKIIDDLTPQDEEFKGTLTDQFAQAFGQVASLIATQGLAGAVGKAGKAASALEMAEMASQAIPKATGATSTALKAVGEQLSAPSSISAGLAMGQSEFEKAKQAGATDDQAFNVFLKNLSVGSVLETIPVMGFLKRFEKASAGGITNYLKTKAVGGLVGGTEEMTTEVIQQLYSNGTARDIYNVNQDLFDGVAESGGVGFGVGFLLNAMGANAKILRKEGKKAEADMVEKQIQEFEQQAKNGGPSSYKLNGLTLKPDVAVPIIENMNGAELAKANLEIINDPELKATVQQKIVTHSVKEQVRQGNPNLNEPSLNAITDLELELKKLEGNTTQTGKDKAAAIRQQIKNIQENPIKEEAVAEAVQAVEAPEATQKRIDRISELEDTLSPESTVVLEDAERLKLQTELERLKTEQDAIQKQATNESVLRSQQPQMGLQQVGEGNVQPEVATTGTEEITPTQQRQEVVLNTLNPTGTIFSEYKSEDIDRLPLGENITTYDVTAGVNPTEKITIYRGVPNDVNEIKSGDFVTTNKQLATDYAGTGKVISMEVNANEILDDKTEPLGEEYILRIPQAEVSSKTPKFVRDITALITPATVRGFSPLTERIKKLSLNYDKLVKQYAKKKDPKVLAKIKTAETQILNDAKQEIIDAVAKVDGVAVQFKDTKRGLWDKKFEPSFNMTLSVSPQADTKKVSDLLFDFAEKYSQDAFILEADSEFEEDVFSDKREMPLTEFDENNLMHYPQIIYTFAKPITDEQVADLSVALENEGVDAFNINNNELQVSVIKFLSEDEQNNLTNDEQYEERTRDLDSKAIATAKATSDVLGSDGKGTSSIRIKKSSYQGATNEGTADQTRQFNRSDVLKAFKESTTKVETLAVELADLRQKEIELQKEGKKLSPEDQTRFNELNKKVQPVVQRTFEANKKLYEDAKAEVEGIAKDAIAKVDASISPFPIKRPERASVKAIRWYNAFTEKLGDAARVNIVVDTDANADKVFKIIDKKYPGNAEVRRITETTELGYPKRLIEIRTSNGTIAEIQVITNEAYLAKDGLQGFTGDEKQKDTAKQKLDAVRARLGWNIPDGLGHYFYEIQRDTNVDENLRDEAARLSDLYYDAFTNSKSKLAESFMKDVEAFKKNVDAADKSQWDAGNNGKAPQSLIDYKPTKTFVTAEIEVEVFKPITIKDVKTAKFNKNDALDYIEDEKETESGRTVPYLSSVTVEATNPDGDSLGTITKVTDEDNIFYFTVEDIDGNEIGGFDGFETLGDAKKALTDSYNKIKQKEFSKEAKKKAKVAEKVVKKVAQKEATPAPQPQEQVAQEEVSAEEKGAIDELMDLDVTDEDNLKKIFDVLDNLDDKITKRLFGAANDAMLGLPLSTVQLVVKTLKALVKGGMVLRDAIKKVSADNNISQETVKDIINISPIQEGFNALMGKVDELIARQKKRGIEEKKIVSNLDTLIRNSEVYDNANDAQKKIMEREGRAKMNARERRAPSIGRILGVLKDITNVSRQDKLKVISEIRKLAKDASKDLAKEIRDLASIGKITANQAANIVARFGKVNMLSEISVSKFVDYMTKVFNDAEYSAKLGQANQLKKDISKLAKDKNKNANLRDLSTNFIEIDPSMVDDIDAYNDMASKIKEAIKGSTIRGEDVTFAEMVNIDEASNYINETIKSQDEKIRQEKIAEIQDLLGVDVSEFSYDDIVDILQNDKPTTEYNEGIIRSSINKMFNIYSTLINESIDTGKDPFTGEDVEYSKKDVDLIKQFMGMDLSMLTPKEALQAVDALANFLQNKSTAKMESVVKNYEGIIGAKEIEKSGIKASPLKKYNMEWLGQLLGNQFTNLNILIERMFKGFRVAGKVMDKMGLSDLINNKAASEKQSNNIIDKYVEQFYNREANGESYNSEYNNTERGLAAFMMRNVIGTSKEMQEEFNRRKNLIKESIQVLSEGNEQEQKKAELYQQVYDKLLKDSESIEEVKKNTDKTNMEGIDFWMNQWADKYEQMADVSENVYNTVLDKDLNYTPDRYSKLSSDTGVVELKNDESAFHGNNGGLYKKESSGLMAVTRGKKLPTNPKNGVTNRYVDLSFDNNNANSMYDALVDISTAAPIRQIEGFLNSKYFKNIVPNSDNATILKGRIDLYVRNIRNKNPYSSDEMDRAIKQLNRIAAIGVGQALGGPTQVLKQVIPVAINTIANAGTLDLSAILDEDKNNFIQNSGYAIANRGIESQAQVKSINRLIEEAAKTKGQKLLKGIEKANEFWLKNFLINADVYIAKASWLTYYEQELKNLGIDPKGIDYKTHKLNKQAADYAQRMVDRQQNVSDSDLAGKIFASKDAKTQAFVKGIMPFASFRMNQSARLGADLATLTSKTATKEDKKIAAKSLSGYAVEAVTFRLVGIGITTLLGAAVRKAMDRDETEEEKKKRLSNLLKGARTGTITDLLSPLPLADKFFQMGASPFLDKIEKETKLPVSIYGASNQDILQSAGLFGIAAERLNQTIDVAKLAATGKYTDDFGKEKSISDKNRRALGMFVAPAILSNFGLAPSEVNTAVRYAIKDAKAKSKTYEDILKQQEKQEETDQRLESLEKLKTKTRSQEELDAIENKIDELEATPEEKKIMKLEDKVEKAEKDELLTDPKTDVKYDNESELKRYNPRLYQKNFGVNSQWYKEHKAEKKVQEKLSKEMRRLEDLKYKRNSDGTLKRR